MDPIGLRMIHSTSGCINTPFARLELYAVDPVLDATRIPSQLRVVEKTLLI